MKRDTEAHDLELLKAAMDAMGTPVFITGADPAGVEPEVVYANPSLSKMTGYGRDEVVGRTPGLFHGPDTDGSTVKQLAECLTAGREFDGELLHYRKDGSAYWAHLRVNPVRNASGEIANWVFVQRDVSGDREWADEMQRINAVLSVQMELSPDGILVVDSEGRVIAYNGRFQKMWGIPLESFASGRQDDLLRHILDQVEDPEAYRAGMETFYQSGEKRLDDEVALRDGRIFDRYCVATRSPQGQFYGWLWYFSDVTPQREFERRLGEARREAEAASQAKSQFLANMSHEIRTPLNGIIGMTEILMETEVTSEQRDFLSTIQASGDNLLILINDLLDLSKIESGRLELDETSFDLFSLVEDSLAVVGARVGTKNLDLGYLIDSALPERFTSDENRIRQVLINLLGNAVKFTEQGEVVLDVKPRDRESLAAGETTPETVDVQFSVRDTGIGISKENQNKLFKPFSQVDPSTTRRYGGSGLGLSICRRLVDLLGGKIWVESEPGEGTIFHFTVPLKVDPDSARRMPLYLDLSGRSLLVVDDNPTNRSMIRHQAARQGIRVDEASGGPAALEKLRGGERYDVLVIDMQMPEMDGLTLAQRIRELPGCERQPILLATSLGRYGGVKQEAARLGLSFLSKPFRQFQFVSHLSEIFGMTEQGSAAASANSDWDGSAFDPDLRILLAEDNPVNLKVALGLLRRLGLDAGSAPDGKQAVEQWRQGRQDVIFMDVHMPEMDGLTATREIRRLSGEKDRPWIVAMTADALVEDRDRCIEAGMNDYLSKPVKGIDLAAVLRRVPAGNASRADPAPEPPQASGVSESMLAGLAELGEAEGDAFLRELVEVFLADVPEQIAEMREAAARGDAPSLTRAAHSVKGSSSNFGAAQLQEKCLELETRAKEGALDDAASRIDEIEKEFAGIERELRTRFLDG